MKILLTGGGTGGHFYPAIAVAQQVRKISDEKKLLQPKIYYIADKPYDENILFKNNIIFKQLVTGKIRRYFSILNFFDFFKTIKALGQAIIIMFTIYPDVVFSNGGFGSFPILFAARLFKIPILIHSSDIVPGKVVRWASKFARKISVGFPEAINYLPKDKVAYTGNPLRMGLSALKQGAHEFLKLDPKIPTILILGGSQGAKIINDIVIDSLPVLIDKYQIIHQVGKNNFEEATRRANVVLENNKFKKRYKPFKFLEPLALRMSTGAADLIISRAGAGSISEIAMWGVPSIIIPITNSAGNHQRKNAFSYARSGAATVIEEKNLSINLLLSEIKKVITDKEIKISMSKNAKEFAKLDASQTIANGILEIALKHEK